ncbi:hypothetical protein PVMG_06243 [Plasmodium vivax Mauritania I]|uniref:Uncharacterized protein n=1 Tax=Plasmodium vivax Mauritania I TaxID=1035515 RepID=A0A0J9T4U9_PLAVI|nr:hypothetical protein PVMG_06243 [Plasmodium vivax Mauritania I]
MFATRKDDFFEKLDEKYHFLWNFSLGSVYSSFILSQHGEDSFNDVCKVLSQTTYNSKCDFSSICKTVGTLLLQLSDNSVKETKSNFSKECDYLNYWIYYIIKDSLDCENISSFYKLVDGIKQGLTPTGQTCSIQNFNIDKEEFLQKKTLFFHTEILHWIKNEYNGINNSDRAEYNQYLGEAYNFYKGIICSADSQIKTNSNEELMNFKNIFNDTIKYLKEKPIGIWQPVIPEINESMCANKFPITETGSELQGAQRASVGPSLLRGGPGESALPGLLSAAGDAPSNLQVSEGQDFNGNLPEEVRPNKGGTIASSLAGSCFFLGMMYKVKRKYLIIIFIYSLYILLT